MIGDREIALVEPGYDEVCEAAGTGTLIQRCNWPRHPTVSGMRQFGVSRLLGLQSMGHRNINLPAAPHKQVGPPNELVG